MSNEVKKNNQAPSNNQAIDRRNLLLGTSTLVAAATLTSDALAQAQTPAPAPAATPAGRKPNILVILGRRHRHCEHQRVFKRSDGLRNPEHRPHRPRRHQVPALLRRAVLHGWTRCLPHRAARHSHGANQSGIPRAPMGMSQLDPSVGGLLKNLGYATGQFGKNHVGDRNESLPTVNGFDEFFGNLYHLNAEEEPELPDYPKDPAYRAKWGPRGVLRCKASDRDDPTVDPRFGKIGKQTIEDTGALTKKRMETIDDETSAAAIDYMKRQQAAGKPFFVWFNSTRMHLRHSRPIRSPRPLHSTATANISTA